MARRASSSRTRLALAAGLFGIGLAVLGGAASPAAAGEWHRHGGPGYGGAPRYASGWGYRGAATPGLDRHRWRQEQWQRYGEATGRVTPRESWRINRAQAGLARHEAWARSDGVVTPWERRELREHARHVDRLIARSMNNGYHYGRGHGYGW
ncbi:MAG: hypothetical protein IRZ13_17725 [Acetobacteraceae bacterium]|nr:hypothetical protein [Acetobacteraceae bacterium]